MLFTVTYLKSPQKVRQVDNVLIDAGSQIQAGGFRSLVLIEAGGFYLRFYGTQRKNVRADDVNNMTIANVYSTVIMARPLQELSSF